MPIKKYTGSCHCGKVKYEADIDLSKGTGKCNCTFCAKVRSWKTFVKPNEFRLISGQDDVSGYSGKNETSKSFFCKTCGVRTYETGSADYMGGDFVGIYLASLNNVDQDELAAAPIRYFDGLHNNWMNPPADVRNL